MADLDIGDVRKYLDRHGFGFQYAVLRTMQDLFETRASPWRLEAAEFPVGTTEKPIHIDFILRASGPSSLLAELGDPELYMVAECKRADPARANWCFAQVPYTTSNPIKRELYFQGVKRTNNGLLPFTLQKLGVESGNRLAFELRTNQKGDGTGSGQAINDACTQVLRGMNGLVDEMFSKNLLGLGKATHTSFVPVIFTTATLYTVTGDLSRADLTAGQLPADWGALEKVEWLWYTYHQSAALSHHIPPDPSQPLNAIGDILRADSARTIAVVGPDGIEPFADLKTQYVFRPS